VPRRKLLTLPVVLTEHVFDKVRSIDMTLAEFEELLGDGEVIEEQETARPPQRTRPRDRLEAPVTRGHHRRRRPR
jgi:hypothetical protein